MGLLKSKGDKSKAPEAAPIKKYNYAQFLAGEGAPSSAAVNTAAQYSGKAASSAALQVELESSKKARRGATLPQVARSRVCSPARVWMHMLTILQVLIAGAIIGVIAGCLNKQQAVPPAVGAANANASLPASYSVCYATTRSVNICWYSYWAAALSMGVSLAISAFNVCCPRRRHAFCLSFEALLGLVGCAWWIGSAVTST